ncbi:uncharacterized protein RB166_009453 [Leptodactylus fuscus]
MNFISCILLAILVVGSMVYGNTYGTLRRSRPMAIKRIRHGPEMGLDGGPLLLVRKRSTSNGNMLDENFAVSGRRRRQAFHDLSGDPTFMFYHTSEHGTFNQDTYSCDDIMSRPCKRPSDCYGCLGLFTCLLPQGRCDFKSVAKQTGIFYQSLQQDEASH